MAIIGGAYQAMNSFNRQFSNKEADQEVLGRFANGAPRTFYDKNSGQFYTYDAIRQDYVPFQRGTPGYPEAENDLRAWTSGPQNSGVDQLKSVFGGPFGTSFAMRPDEVQNLLKNLGPARLQVLKEDLIKMGVDPSVFDRYTQDYISHVEQNAVPGLQQAIKDTNPMYAQTGDIQGQTAAGEETGDWYKQHNVQDKYTGINNSLFYGKVGNNWGASLLDYAKAQGWDQSQLNKYDESQWTWNQSMENPEALKGEFAQAAAQGRYANSPEGYQQFINDRQAAYNTGAGQQLYQQQAQQGQNLYDSFNQAYSKFMADPNVAPELKEQYKAKYGQGFDYDEYANATGGKVASFSNGAGPTSKPGTMGPTAVATTQVGGPKYGFKSGSWSW